MTITFLGTNAYFDTQTGNTSCILIDTEKYYLILDAGHGIYKINQYIKESKPIYLFLSHLHFDHTIGIHTFSRFSFRQGIKIFSYPKSKYLIEQVFKRPFTAALELKRMSIDILEYKLEKQQLPIKVDVKKLVHSVPSFGFRFIIDNKIICYCGDTEVCNNTKILAYQSDIFIHESTLFKPDTKFSKLTGHCNWQEVTKLAKSVKVKKLYLTHFSPDRYPTIRYRQEVQKHAQKIFPNTFTAYDDLVIKL